MVRPALWWLMETATVLLFAAAPSAGWAVVHVDVDNVRGPQDGKSWASAYNTVQEGIDAAHNAGGGDVWIAQGTYKPTSTRDRTVSFQLKPDVALYGGFSGRETRREQRDWAKQITILSGDIGVRGDNRDNSYHVVKGADNATIDGFTITAGNADGDAYDGKGGGMYNDFNCSPTLTNCIFAGNSAERGGGMANDGSSCPALTNCVFTRNHAKDLGGGLQNGTYRPGGVACSPTLTNCILWGNITPSGPKEISNWHEDAPTVTFCVIEGGYGGRGNINADPLFVDPENGDYHIGPGSPGIDAGNSPVAPRNDRDGNPRNDPVDMGAYEWQGEK